MADSNVINFDSSKHPVHAVTVFQSDRADVKRLVQVDLKAGQNHIKIEKLPSCLDENSIRVNGTGHAVIFDVIYKPPPPKSERSGPEVDRIAELRKDTAALKEEKDTHENQLNILKRFMSTLKGKKTSTTNLGQFMDLFASKRREIYKLNVEIDEKVEKLDKEIKKLEESIHADEESEKRRAGITVVVLADGDGPAEIALSYVVTNASWTPLYDVRARISTTTKDDSTVQIQYRGSIKQSTGEDWNSVALTLSTASPLLGSVIPKLRPSVIYEGYANKTIQMNRQQNYTAYDYPDMMNLDGILERGERLESLAGKTAELSISAEAFRKSARKPQLSKKKAVVRSVEAGTMNATFGIEGLSTIPSNTAKSTESHKVVVAEVDLVAELEWIVVPREKESAFLKCQAKNESEYVFLAGHANIFMDDNFVSKSYIEHVSPQETFSCSLGVDSAIRVTYHPLMKKISVSGTWGIGSKSETTLHTRRVTIKNTRQTALGRLILKDQIPVSTDDQVKVNVVSPSQLNSSSGKGTVNASELDKGINIVRWEQKNEDGTGGDAENGIIEWVCELAPGATVNPTLSWEVIAPAKLMLVEG